MNTSRISTSLQTDGGRLVIMNKRRYVTGTPEERFKTYVDTSAGPDGCHPWTGGTDKDGYGRFSVQSVMIPAHRWLAGHMRGLPLTPEEEACHTCDNPPCCNGKHIFVDSHGGNMADAGRKGRRRGRNSNLTHCQRGHEFSKENTYVDPRGKRVCKECRRVTYRIWRQT